MAPSTASRTARRPLATAYGIRNPATRAVTLCGSWPEQLSCSRSFSSGPAPAKSFWGWCADAFRRTFAFGADIFPRRGRARADDAPWRRPQVHSLHLYAGFRRRISFLADPTARRAYRLFRLPARRICNMDPLAAHPLPPRSRRHQHVPRHTDNVPDADFRLGFVEQRSETCQGILRDAPAPRSGCRRRFSLARHVPLLSLLGTDADSHGVPHWHLGPRAPRLRRRKICSLHHGRFDPDARRHHLAVQRYGNI